ncbi:cytochrome P450 4V2-like isoform X2 [Plodia interpunctella]|nr:cytochrome P450 4V2-like isoform X2 [Plodia interpunctella]XP_053619583.1 cytochrome P450 4V2-like isoform X2 [Plodia interpunctella]
MVYTGVDSLEKGGVIKIDNVLPFMTHYVITDPDDLLTVSNSSNKHYFYNVFYARLKDSIFNHLPLDETWKTNRKQMSVAFTPKSIKNLTPVMNRCGRQLCEAWAAEGGKPFEHLETVHLAVYCAVAGDDVDIALARDYIDVTSSVEDALSRRLCSFFMHFDIFFNLTSVGRKHNEECEYVNSLCRKIIRDKKERIKSPEYTGPKSVTDYIIQFCDFDDDDELMGEVNTIITAGYTTTSSSLTSLFMLLGTHPEAQEKLYQELQSVLGSSERDIVMEDLERLPYLDAVVKESVRLYPAAPIVFRYSEKPYVLKNFTIPPKRFYAINLYGANRHQVWGPDSFEFKPERWLDPKMLPPAHAFTSFMLGKRDCVGKRYGLSSMKIMTVHVVKRYKIFSDISKCQFKIGVIMRPATGGIIRVEERNPRTTNI